MRIHRLHVISIVVVALWLGERVIMQVPRFSAREISCGDSDWSKTLGSTLLKEPGKFCLSFTELEV